ncbi:hypothetical protein Tco_1540547 [Tanacetum coccineum]
MDDPNITMEEYIRLEEEKSCRCGKVYNWETATHGKIWCDKEVHDLRSVETKFPAIVFDNAFTSEIALSCEPTVSPLNDNKIDFRISFDESEYEDYTVIYDKNSFSYKIIYVGDLKTDSENDNDKVNMPSFPSPKPTVSYFSDLDFFKEFENKFPAIVYNDALTSKSDFLTEPTLSPQHIDKFDLKDETSLYEASVSVMPLSTYLNLGLGELAHTKLTVELADKTVKYPKGIAENMLVRIEYMDDYHDEGMGDVIFGEPLLREVRIKARRFNGMITIYNGDDEVSEDDKRNGISHPYQKLKGFYKGVLNLGPEFIRDPSMEEWLNTAGATVDMEYLVKVSKKACILELKRRNIKITDSDYLIRHNQDINKLKVFLALSDRHPTYRETTTDQVNMDDPNITMEEYIMLEEEKSYRSVETKFPAIVFDDTFMSEIALSCEPTVSPLDDNKIDFRIPFDESDDEDYIVISDKNSFSYKIISVNDLKTDWENDNDKVNMPSFPSPKPTVSYFSDLDFFKEFENKLTAIVYNNALTSKSDFLTKPTLSPQHIDKFLKGVYWSR